MRSLKASNWIRLHLPGYAELKATLLASLDGNLRGTSRSKRISSRRTRTDEDSTDERLDAWEGVPDLLPNPEQLAHMKSEFQVLMFPD